MPTIQKTVDVEIDIDTDLDITELNLTLEDIRNTHSHEVENLWDEIENARYRNDKQALDKALEKGIEAFTGRLVRFSA